MVLYVLSMNKDAIGFVVKSSEFWIKIICGAARPVLTMMIFHHVGRHENIIPEYLGCASNVITIACCL